MRGELRQAAAIYRTAIQKGGRAPILAIAHLDLAALHFEWNELEACHAELHDAIELNRYGGNSEVQAAIYLMLTRLECARGNFSAMEAAFGDLRQLEAAGGVPDTVRQRTLGCLIELALARGDLPAAQSLASAVTPELDAHPFYRFLVLTSARLALAQGVKGSSQETFGR